MSTKCHKTLGLLCYICGQYTPKSIQLNISEKVEEAYLKKYNFPIKKLCNFVPKIICKPCYSITVPNRQHQCPTTPMIWNEPDDSHQMCYACLLPNLQGRRVDGRSKIKYPEFPDTNSIRAVWLPDRDTKSQPKPSTSTQEAVPVMLSSSSSHASSGEQFMTPSKKLCVRAPLLLFQGDLNDLCRDLGLGVRDSELLGSRLAERNLLQPGVETTEFRKDNRFSSKFENGEIVMKVRKQKDEEEEPPEEYDEEYEARQFITKSYKISYIKDLEGLFELFGQEHNPSEWRLFLDGSCSSFKVVLLHNKNELPSIPLAFCKKLPEQYDNVKQILHLIKYYQYNWDLIVDFKLVNIIMGLMGAASKHPCIYCLWNARHRDSDKYTKRDWPVRPIWNDEGGAQHNAIKPPLVNESKMLLPPLHIKIGLVTQLFKRIYWREEPDQPNKARKVLHEIFPTLSKAKISAGVFDGPQIKKLFSDQRLPEALDEDENRALFYLKEVCNKFLGNYRAENHEELIKNMMEAYEKLQINVTIKMHTLICHLDKFKQSCGQYSDEQGERFHQDLKKNEADYCGKDMSRGLGRYCWNLVRETNQEEYKKRADCNQKMKYFYVKDK